MMMMTMMLIQLAGIRILDGNLSKLEETFGEEFTWNSIKINGASFKHINQFDNIDVTALGHITDDPQMPVMTSYSKKKSRLKTWRCTANHANKIVASDLNCIIINDTGRKSGVAMVAKYLLFKDDSKYKNIHILNFIDTTIKALFFNEYHFDTVPTINLSELMADAKVWYNANKATRGVSNGTIRVNAMEYIDISGDEASIETSDVTFKDIEENVYYINAATGRRSRGCVSVFGFVVGERDFANAIKFINDKLDLGIDRVYITSQTTRNTKWFQKAIDNKEWLQVMAIINEGASKIDAQDLVNKTIDNEIISVDIAKEMLNEFEDNHIITNLFNTVINISADDEAETFVNHLKQLNVWHGISKNITPAIDLNAMKNAIENVYPYLDWNGLRWGKTCSNKAQLIKYVRSIDMYDNYIKSEDNVTISLDYLPPTLVED